MALFKGSPSKSGELMWERRTWLLSDPKCAEKLHSVYPCRGHWLPALMAIPVMAQLSAQTLGLGKELQETLLEISVPWLGSQI